MIASWISPELMQRFAGSLLHFVWQGALVAMIVAIVLRLSANRTAEWRYTVSITALLLMLAAPVLTFILYAQTGLITLKFLQFVSDGVKASASSLPSASQAAVTASWTQWIVFAWIAGVAGCSIRLIAGWRMSRSLTIKSTAALPSGIQDSFNEIMERLAMTRPVRLLATLRFDTPVAVGWLRPVVLIPISALTGLDENQLRAIFAHELAHIRRHDFLVNMIQRGVESILFYHPAVWWLSARIRSEREHCCDDLAVQICGDRSAYAQALIELERVRSVEPELAVAATGGNLTQRIHRILGYRIVENDWQSAIAALLFVVVWVMLGVWQSDATLVAKPFAPPPLPAPIVVKSAAATPTLVTAMNAIAAIVTANPVQPEPQQSAPSDQSTTVGNSQTGAVEGVLRDDEGKPAPGVRVAAAVLSADVNLSLQDNIARVVQTDTDKEGRYRLEEIPPGAYTILAGRLEFPTYYPGTLDVIAGKIVTVRPGTTVANINFALEPMSRGQLNPLSRTPPFKPQVLSLIGTSNPSLTLYVSTQIAGDGKIPIFANGRVPKLRLTKVDTNARYEMGLGGVAIRVPLNLTIIPDEYKVSVEDLPDGYSVKSITYRADEPGVRVVDVRAQTLKISARAINESYRLNGGTSIGAPDLPIAITLTAPAKVPPDIRVTGTSEGMIVLPHIPVVGGSLPSDAFGPSDVGVYLSGKPGVLFADGTFEFAGVSAGLHRIVLYTFAGNGPGVAVADVMVGPADRHISDVPLQIMTVLPKSFFSPPVLSATGVSGPTLLALSSVTIRVLDEASQQPITSGFVTLTGALGSSRTYVGTSKPVFSIPNVLPGSYSVSSESYGYRSKNQTVNVGNGDSSIDIMLARIPK